MPESPLTVIPLGGLGEIGQNMLALEYEDDIVVVDAGVLFPGEDTPGIDFAIPDISYLRENRDRVRAILITHGHEDHIGALPFVLAEIDAPVYALAARPRADFGQAARAGHDTGRSAQRC